MSNTAELFQKYVQELTAINWADVEEASVKSQSLLQFLYENKEYIQNLFEENSENLLSHAEAYDFLVKIPLYHDPDDKFRLRLHYFLPGYSNRIHYHRWMYSAVILKGSYLHYLYGTEKDLDIFDKQESMIPTQVRREVTGNVYTLNHNIFHAVKAEPYTISLCVRGPAVKDRFLVWDDKNKLSWWQYGEKSEAYEERREKKITTNEMQQIMSKVFTHLEIGETTCKL